MFTQPASQALAQNLSLYPENSSLIEVVREFMLRLRDSQEDFVSFHTNMRNLERILLRGEQETEACQSALSSLAADELEYLNNLYCLWETQLEKRFVHFLSCGMAKHYLDYPLYARFERLIDREVSLLEGYMPKRVLFMGSGPMPITALCLKDRIGVPLDCLERNSDAIEDSRIVMRKLGCEGQIDIYQGYGEDVDVAAYDVILIALLAKPKKAILENILRTCQDDVRIICRTSDGSRSVFYEPTHEGAIPADLKRVGHARAGIDDTISSWLLRRA